MFEKYCRLELEIKQFISQIHIEKSNEKIYRVRSCNLGMNLMIVMYVMVPLPITMLDTIYEKSRPKT